MKDRLVGRISEIGVEVAAGVGDESCFEIVLEAFDGFFLLECMLV